VKDGRSLDSMSVSSLRAELLELLDFLFPEKKWPSRVSAAELADFALQNLGPQKTGEREQRALAAGHWIKDRQRARGRAKARD
jgi:hypothetical protein